MIFIQILLKRYKYFQLSIFEQNKFHSKKKIYIHNSRDLWMKFTHFPVSDTDKRRQTAVSQNFLLAFLPWMRHNEKNALALLDNVVWKFNAKYE